MLGINMDDVKAVLNNCLPYLIFLGVVLALGVAAIVAAAVVKTLSCKQKYIVRTQSVIAMLLALVIALNLIMMGPLSNLLDLATTPKLTISEKSIEESKAFGVRVAEEGIVLLENKGLLPLAPGKINVFGWASSNPCYGGSGSGGISDQYPKTSLLDGIKSAGFEINSELTDFYTAYRADRPVVDMFAQDWTLPEPPVDQYSDTLISNAQSFSDTAVVVYARTGCENADLPMEVDKVNYTNNSSAYEDFGSDRHYLELNRTEEDLLAMVCEKFANVIVVINCSSAMELDFVEKYNVKGLIWCPGAGQTGFDALGSILAGKVNPSGKTTDILVRDLLAAPCANNFLITKYDNMDEHAVGDDGAKNYPGFMNYVEGIYVGYKFWETAGDVGFLDYDESVQYPFGYGLTYTSFTQEMGGISEHDGTISFDVTVTNTGGVAGKDVVQAYFNPPYTNGGIEKATANLVQFEKTGLLQPGASEKVTITFKVEDMASFDDKDKGCYVLEKGDYEISIRSDSHHVIDSKVFTVDADTVFDSSNPRSSDQAAATLRFDAAGDVTYLSRKDSFSNFAEATAAPKSASMGEEWKARYVDITTFDPASKDNPNDVMPTTGAQNGVKLEQLRDKSYDDPMWEKLLDQLTVDEMNGLIGMGGYQTVAIESIGKIATSDCDGPVDIYSNFTGVSSIGLPAIVMLAFTWNKDLAHDYGSMIAQMADEMGVSGWYAPSMNMHRSAFAGRNFEYLSEDGVLSGYMAVGLTAGALEHGVYPYIKHFALNDAETDRWYKNSVWSNEQAIREIYLKPFEMAVKEGGATAVMSSYNYIGVEWAGGCDALLNKVLRDEWGFKGMVLTDYYLPIGGAMDADIAVRNGGDIMLANMDWGNNYVDASSASAVIAMRNATHNVLYTVVNSRAYAEGSQVNGLNWRAVVIAVTVAAVVALAAVELFVVRPGLKKRDNNMTISK